MISIDNLSKNYGRQVLFDNISFKVNRRERVGVVGRNGHGKTTLFRLISGLEEPDSGAITIPKHYRIGYVEQEVHFSEGTVLEEAATGLPAAGKDETWKVEKILSGLGFSQSDLHRAPAELSGGFQVRLNLAKVLLADDNLLLLDEPNNYLDITSIRWLTRFLLNWPGELLLITHDRGFMDNVVTHTLGIHRRKARKIAGDTEKYYGQIALEEEVYEKTRVNDERKMKEMDLFITRFRAKARLAGLVQSRLKSLAKMEKREKLEKIKTLDFAFAEKPFHGKYVLGLNGVSYSYDPEKPLICEFTISVGARDRVFVIGPNGKGKTTLLKLMAGALRPQLGEVTGPAAVSAGYYEQSNVESLSDSNTVLEEVASANPEMDSKSHRAICGAMMFEGDDALKKISILSGGEKSRVTLAKLIATPLNLLLLDEPTNHLDLESSDALLAAIENFDGAVVTVTHNEMFLHALADRLVVFQSDGIRVYEGDYQRFLEKIGWQEEKDLRPGIQPMPKEEALREKLKRKEFRRLRSELLAERARVLKPLENKIAGLEQGIETAESDLARMNQEIIEASQAKESVRIVELTKAIRRAQDAVDSLFLELEKATQEFDARKPEFDKRLQTLEEEGQ